jgi:hypothetical protein
VTLLARIRYRLTLLGRTLFYGPVCQRCERRHWDTELGRMECGLETRLDDWEAGFVRDGYWYAE